MENPHQPRINLHSHTYRCKHASGDAGDYVSTAHAAGATIYGISDHAPLPDGRHAGVRMAMRELDGYEEAVRDAQAAFPGLKVLLALECEDFAEYRTYYSEEILGRRGYDYLVGAAHYTPFEGAWHNSYTGMENKRFLFAYGKHLCSMMDTGLYAFIAHPDIFGCSTNDWNADLAACSRDILAAAEATGVPLEINAGGFRKSTRHTQAGSRAPYPWSDFWQLASEYRVTVVCNSDAHRPEDAMANLDQAYDVAVRYGLTLASADDLGLPGLAFDVGG